MSRDFSVISGFGFIVDNMIQIWQNRVYLQGLGRNILSQNFTESIKKPFVLRHYFLIPTSTENNLICLFSTQTQDKDMKAQFLL